MNWQVTPDRKFVNLVSSSAVAHIAKLNFFQNEGMTMKLKGFTFRNGSILCWLQQNGAMGLIFHRNWSWSHLSWPESLNDSVRYFVAQHLWRHFRLKIDDPLDAFAVHFGGGFWGLLSTTIIAHDGIVYAISDAIAGKDGKHKVGQAFAVRLWSSLIMV